MNITKFGKTMSGYQKFGLSDANQVATLLATVALYKYKVRV